MNCKSCKTFSACHLQHQRINSKSLVPRKHTSAPCASHYSDILVMIQHKHEESGQLRCTSSCYYPYFVLFTFHFTHHFISLVTWNFWLCVPSAASDKIWSHLLYVYDSLMQLYMVITMCLSDNTDRCLACIGLVFNVPMYNKTSPDSSVKSRGLMTLDLQQTKTEECHINQLK